ncbi:helix-turn-helix domain-containing protein [Dongia sp.]|uniref:helix-turn-helix domain-containing protein n=1 Tax=Dongia sp. TaxID=1977262 RepID=UPI0035B06036
MNLDPMLDATAEVFGVHKILLAGVGRARRLAYPRFAFYLVARETLGLSLPAIGRAVSRDHTTVMHGLVRAEELKARDADFAAKVALLITAAEQHLVANKEAATVLQSRLERRAQRHVLQAIHRLALENPKGFDQLVLQAGSYDPTHHH